MYCNIEKGKLKRVRRRSGVYGSFAYNVPDWGDSRYGHWHFGAEIIRPLRRQVWTISIRHSSRFEGKHGKANIYLFRISFYGIFDAYKQAMLEGGEFDFFNSYVVQSAVTAKFPDSYDQIIGKINSKFSPAVDKVVNEFLGTHEYECFARYIALKKDVDAKVKALREADDARKAEKERDSNAGNADNSSGPVPTKKDRTRIVAQEMAGKFARAAKKKFHPDLARPFPTTEDEKGKAHDKSIIAQDVANDMMSLMEDYVNYEIDLDPEKGTGVKSAGSPEYTER